MSRLQEDFSGEIFSPSAAFPLHYMAAAENLEAAAQPIQPTEAWLRPGLLPKDLPSSPADEEMCWASVRFASLARKSVLLPADLNDRVHRFDEDLSIRPARPILREQGIRESIWRLRSTTPDD